MEDDNYFGYFMNLYFDYLSVTMNLSKMNKCEQIGKY